MPFRQFLTAPPVCSSLLVGGVALLRGRDCTNSSDHIHARRRLLSETEPDRELRGELAELAFSLCSDFYFSSFLWECSLKKYSKKIWASFAAKRKEKKTFKAIVPTLQTVRGQRTIAAVKLAPTRRSLADPGLDYFPARELV